MPSVEGFEVLVIGGQVPRLDDGGRGAPHGCRRAKADRRIIPPMTVAPRRRRRSACSASLRGPQSVAEARVPSRPVRQRCGPGINRERPRSSTAGEWKVEAPGIESCRPCTPNVLKRPRRRAKCRKRRGPYGRTPPIGGQRRRKRDSGCTNCTKDEDGSAAAAPPPLLDPPRRSSPPANA